MSIGVYGKRVVGEEVARREREIVKSASQIYGRRVTGQTPALVTTTALAVPAPATAGQRDADLAAENEALTARLAELEAKLAQKAGTPEADPAGDPGTSGGEPGTGTDPKGEGTAAAGADGYLNVAELAAAVRANPALIDGFLAQEKARQPKPRITALRTLLEVETSEAGARRPEVVREIEALIAELG